MKLFSTHQIREIDKYTVENEPISSIALMERAADQILRQFKKDWSRNRDVAVFCGPGNNGGDGLALGRMLLQTGYDAQVILLRNGKLSADCEQNKGRIIEYFPDFFTEQSGKFLPVKLSEETIIVDALFGTGLSRPLEGIFADAVRWINSRGNTVVAIDIPSGLSGEMCAANNNTIVKADTTYTLQFPKTAFFFAENEPFVGNWKVADIQLHAQAIEKQPTKWHFTEKKDIIHLLKKRSKFVHKGSFGHVFLLAGSKGMAGAAVFSARAASRAGAGLVSVFGTDENRTILQISVPEALYKSELGDMEKYSVFVCGPGIGKSEDTKNTLREILAFLYSFCQTRQSEGQQTCILDADALNIVAENHELWQLIPKNTIITPHVKEFERLFGVCENSRERMHRAQEKARELGIFIILKGAYTVVCSPDENVYFNSTGNSGMATGGMGDVLTGVIAGLLAQNYTTKESAILGVYLHGLAGDVARNGQSEESLLPSDVLNNIGYAFEKLRNQQTE